MAWEGGVHGDRRLVLVGPYPPPWGGIAVHMEALRGLAEERGATVSVIDTGEGHLQRTGEGGVHGGGGAAGLALATRRARGSPLHLHIPGNNLKSWLVAVALGRPFRRNGPGAILTVHSGLSPRTLAVRRNREIARAACIGFQKVFCTNEEIASALWGLGTTGGKLEVLPPFLPGGRRPSRLPRSLASFRKQASPLLAAAVAPGRQYGADVLLGALERLAKRAPGMGAVVFGPGSESVLSSRERERMGLDGRLELLGEIDHETSLAVIASCDVFLRPTRADGDSVSVREALSLGVRVVASDVCKRPKEATLFQAGDPASLARAIEASLAVPPPPWGAGAADATLRLVAAWEAIGLVVEGGHE